MATSLLRFGRLGSVKVESWAILRSSAAPLCTQAEGMPKKTKAASKTAAEAPGDRAALLAYKTAVAFPVRCSLPESIGAAKLVVTAQTDATAVPVTVAREAAGTPANYTDVAQVITTPPVADTAATESLVNATSETSASDDRVPPAAASSETGDPAANGSSSSSSSDSDSDSDSDSEDDDDCKKSEVKTETKTSVPEVFPVKEEVHKVALELKKETEDEKEGPPGLEGSPASAGAQAPTEISTISSGELEDSAPPICTEVSPEGTVTSSTFSSEAAVKPAPEEVFSPAAHAEDLTEAAIPEKVPTDAPSEDTEPGSAEALRGVAAEAVGDEAVHAEVAAEAAAEVSCPVENAEDLVDPTSALSEAAGEELQAEAPVEPSEEAAAAAPPEPEEPFDNSTYKNYQHHSYTPYTFADLDLEMAKFRLPQPSSGRPSPRH